MNKAAELAEQGKLDDAIALLKGKNDIESAIFLGELLEAKGTPEDALALWRKAASSSPDRGHKFRLLFAIASALKRQGEISPVDDEDFRQKANTLEESSRTYASALEFAETDDARAELQAAQALVAESLARLYASTTPEAGASPPAIPFLRRAAAHWSEIRRAEPTLDDATMGLARCLLAIAAYADPTGSSICCPGMGAELSNDGPYASKFVKDSKPWWPRKHPRYYCDEARGLLEGLIARNPHYTGAYTPLVDLLRAQGEDAAATRLARQGKFYAWLPDWLDPAPECTPANMAIAEALGATLDTTAPAFDDACDEGELVPADAASSAPPSSLTTAPPVGPPARTATPPLPAGETEAAAAVAAGGLPSSGRPSAPRTKRSVRVGASRAQSTAAARRRARLEVAIDTLLAERTQRSSALLASLCWQHGCCGQREIDIYSELERRARGIRSATVALPAALMLGGNDDDDIKQAAAAAAARNAASEEEAAYAQNLLLLLLNHGHQPCTLHYAGHALARLGDRRALPLLLRLLPSDVSGLSQLDAAGALAVLGDLNAVPALAEIVERAGRGVTGAQFRRAICAAPASSDATTADADEAVFSEEDLLLDRPAAQRRAALALGTLAARPLPPATATSAPAPLASPLLLLPDGVDLPAALDSSAQHEMRERALATLEAAWARVAAPPSPAAGTTEPAATVGMRLALASALLRAHGTRRPAAGSHTVAGIPEVWHYAGDDQLVEWARTLHEALADEQGKAPVSEKNREAAVMAGLQLQPYLADLLGDLSLLANIPGTVLSSLRAVVEALDLGDDDAAAGTKGKGKGRKNSGGDGGAGVDDDEDDAESNDDNASDDFLSPKRI